MLEQTKWGEFRLKDLFEVSTTKWFDEGKFVLSHKNWKKLFEFVWRTEDNNGIKWYIEKINNTDPNPSNVISVSQIWTIIAQFRKNERYASQNIFMLKPKEEYENIIGLYCISAINTSLKGNFWWGYSNYPTLKTLKELNIQLPIKNWNPDFEFMNKFIAELEATHQAELEAYLRTTWLEDCELSSSELELLKEFEEWIIEWWKFKFSDVFNQIKQWRRLRKQDQISGDIPFVMSWTTNTGIVNYVSNPVAIFPHNSITIDIFWNTFYRNYKFWAWDDTWVYRSDYEYSQLYMLFCSVSMWCSLAGKFSYGNKLRSSQSLNFLMDLPIKNWKPDYELMEKFIWAVQKLVIKDVVIYNQERLKTTEEIISKNYIK